MENLEYRNLIGIWEKDFTEKKEIQEKYENKIREKHILKVLRKISQQYEKYTWFENYDLNHVENNPVNKSKSEVTTCYLRGWVELIPDKKSWSKKGYSKKIYRVTTAGWNRLNNLRPWVIGTFVN